MKSGEAKRTVGVFADAAFLNDLVLIKSHRNGEVVFGDDSQLLRGEVLHAGEIPGKRLPRRGEVQIRREQLYIPESGRAGIERRSNSILP
jgi:hypothetical protein